jgi:hypothetical protein
MNAVRSEQQEREDAGDKLARHVATGIASLVGVAIVAGSGVVLSNRLAIVELTAKCEETRGSVFELHNTLSQYPSAGDLNGCRGRIEALERYLAVDQHRMDKLEKMVEELTHKPDARPDPFTGTQGAALERRIKELEDVQP